ncbi:hypothetical protein TA3x_002933 [Tundrisphaera sp. TA3]|uniref:hypothetical protein n=1 Tax=Tundrisphaera sp. TA3 TaxID=3435775 RepID=UPI003EBA60F4
MERSKRPARPALEGLEGRALLNASKLAAGRLAASAQVSDAQRIAYTTGGGARVTVTLTGAGTLAGSSVGPDGALDLVYSGTNTGSRIIGRVSGAGRARLGSIRDADVSIDSLTGVGAEAVGIVRLPDFNLVSGGTINLLGGVNELTLNSVAANTQIRLRDTPLNTTLANLDGATGLGDDFANLDDEGTVQGIGTLDPTTRAFGGGAVNSTSGAIDFIDTTGNGQNARGTPGLSQQQVSNGRNLTYVYQRDGGLRLTAVGGTFVPGPNLLEPRDVSKPGPAPAPPGVIVSIDRIQGAPRNLPALGNPQIFGVDPVANALIRFDAATGAALQSIPLPAGTTGSGGVALARANGRTLALVGSGNTVLAFDAVTGSGVGRFTTANPALGTITGIGTAGTRTILVNAGSGLGAAQAIDVAASLANPAGVAVPLGATFVPGQEFQLAGGATGVPGTQRLYANGSAFFDTFQPNQTLAGVLTASLSNASAISEADRVALQVNNRFVDASATGGILGNPSPALGSIGSNLALVTSVSPAGNIVSQFNPITLAPLGNVTLATANPLTDLSESFHPELAGSALIDVQGNVQSFRARDANGLVLNDSGNLNRLVVKRLANSTVIGLPVTHVEVGRRVNSSIFSSTRLIGNRGGVTVVDGIRPVGPLFLP